MSDTCGDVSPVQPEVGPTPRRHAPDRARQILTWAVIVLALAALIVAIFEISANEPARAPSESGAASSGVMSRALMPDL